ncbi:transposase [Niveomyces insectorum RCEF 264]|uniref:Transposase n=1 Tax=Niveomyces insectorum RCEF 264 TaxID=1081102 RepID=A0A167VQG5_9HYPO|nr:transposase [Niveomyces insectorum RCEF 264]
MHDYTEDDVKRALGALANGASIRKASREFGIPPATLFNRKSGTVPHRQASKGQQRLTPAQEEQLCGWIYVQDALGLRPTAPQVKVIATTLLRASGDDRPLGKHWLDGFLRRNPSVKLHKVRGPDSKSLDPKPVVDVDVDALSEPPAHVI